MCSFFDWIFGIGQCPSMLMWSLLLPVCGEDDAAATVCDDSVSQQLEEAAKEVADEVTRPRPVGEEAVQDVQVMLKSDAHHASIRSLKVLWLHLPLFLLPCLSGLLIFCAPLPSTTVRPGFPPSESSWHHHLCHASKGQGHQGVSAVSQLPRHHPQHLHATRPGGLRSAAQVQQVSGSVKGHWEKDYYSGDAWVDLCVMSRVTRGLGDIGQKQNPDFLWRFDLRLCFLTTKMKNKLANGALWLAMLW